MRNQVPDIKAAKMRNPEPNCWFFKTTCFLFDYNVKILKIKKG